MPNTAPVAGGLAAAGGVNRTVQSSTVSEGEPATRTPIIVRRFCACSLAIRSSSVSPSRCAGRAIRLRLARPVNSPGATATAGGISVRPRSVTLPAPATTISPATNAASAPLAAAIVAPFSATMVRPACAGPICNGASSG